MARAPWIVVGIAVALAAWMLRYDVLAVGRNGDSLPVAYLLDRWTGGLKICVGRDCVPVGDKKPAAASLAP